jgi:glyoxylase-like metal-dependent hydrolase (beta-lactamase superfamily II)
LALLTVCDSARNVMVGRGTSVNWTILREGRDLTLIDTGYPRDSTGIISSIESIGHRLEDVRAVLITHGHVDHIGGLGALLEKHAIPVFAHPLEVPNLRGEVHEQATVFDVVRHSWRPRGARWLASIARAGGSEHVIADSVRAFSLSGSLDVPGRPTPVLSAGHTSGHTAYLLADEGVIVTGDALITGHPLARFPGPQLLPSFFSHNPADALAALEVIAAAPADVLVPGHGEVWSGDLAAAVAHARRLIGLE